jgi:DNA-binding LytR/AlgR family response regulator
MEAISNASRIDGAILDINLGEERSFVVAQTLSDRDIPVIFVTGYDALVLPTPFASFHRLNKPFNPAALADVLSSVTTR